MRTVGSGLWARRIRAALAARAGVTFVYAAVLAGAASTWTLSVEGSGMLHRSPPATATTITRIVDTRDDTPARVLLVPRRNLLPGSLVDSTPVRLSGITVPVGVAVSEGASLSVDGGAFGPGPMVAERGQAIVLRATAPAAGHSRTVTLTTGTLASQWTLQAMDAPTHTHQTLFGPWGACTASQPCDGQGSQSRDILCLRSDGRFVEVSACGATLSATETRSCPSPAGTAACQPLPAGAQGWLQYCAAGSATRGPCTGTTCIADHSLVEGSCVADNLPPSVALSASAADVDEGATDVAVATIIVTDDGLGSNSLGLGGADAGQFAIDGTTLRFTGGKDFEAPADDSDGDRHYLVHVIVGDAALGASHSSQTLTVRLRDVNEAPAVVLSTSSANVAENSPAVTVAAITISDDALGTNTLSLGGPDAGDFVIDGTTLRFIGAKNFEAPDDSDGDRRYTVHVTVRDAALGASHSSPSLTVTLGDVNEAPVLVGATTASASGTIPGVRLPDLSARFADPDAGATVTPLCTLVTPGPITAVACTSFAAIDATFSAAGTGTVRVTASDGTLTSAEGVLVTVNAAVPSYASCATAPAAPGSYSIDPDGVGGVAPFQAWCEGGWMLALRAADSGSTFVYHSSHWTTGSTLNTGDMSPTSNTDGKFAAFNLFPATQIRGCLRNLSSGVYGCQSYNLPASPRTLLNLFGDPVNSTFFQGSTTGRASAALVWLTMWGRSEAETHMGANNNAYVAAGINLVDNLGSVCQGRVRFGVLLNNEVNVHTTNDAVGFAANGCTATEVSAGFSEHRSPAIPTRGQIWVR